MANKLSEFVTVNRQFLRSIRLDADFGRMDAIEGYVLQPSAQTLLETTAKHLRNTQQRAFTWTGPYGGGKSSLALILASLAGGENKIRKVAHALLADEKNKEITSFFGDSKPWVVLPVVGKRASVVDEIGTVLDHHLHNDNRHKHQNDKRRDIVKELVQLAETRNKMGGVLLIIDELGKFLEYAAQTGEDIGFYQDLAEAASRCKGNLVIIGVLHQAFEQYALRLGQTAQQEWAKIQGRYIDIPLVAGSDETVFLIGQALQVDYKHPASLKIAEQVSKVIRKRRPSAAADIETLLDLCWPLHPVTAAMLGPASKKRFGQNERSVFSFLASAEPLGFAEGLKGLDATPKNYYWPYQFWDYLQVNLEPAILASPDGHRWAACAEAIERTEARLSPLHVELVKTIGLIELLRNGSGLASEKELLVSCMSSLDTKKINQALNELTSASIIIFRKHIDAYGIYAGSDFDIENAVRKAKSVLDVRSLSNLSDLLDLGPVTARRYYWNTGTMRWFSRAIIQEKYAETYIKDFEASENQCGEFVLVLCEQRLEAQKRNRIAEKLSNLGHMKNLLVGVPTNADRIEDLIEELTSLEFVRENSRELDSDSIAMREITGRILLIRSTLSDELRDAFHNATWHYNGDFIKNNNGSLAHIASDIAELIYSKSPYVHSELANRNNLSSNVTKARRELLYAMLNHANQPNLGYTTFSADAGLFYTIIGALGLYREQKGIWSFCEPRNTERSASLIPAWEAAKDFILNSSEIITLAKLYDVWSKPPFGIKTGLLPIFALAFFMAYRNQLALYIEGVFIPDVTEAHLDEWLQDPKRIGWRFVRIEATEKKMLKALSSSLSKRLGTSIAADALDSARALVTLIFQLPVWTRRTSLLSQEAKEVRHLLLNASDPHKVLFVDLPLILDTCAPIELADKIAAITGELTEAFALRLRSVEKNMLSALDHQGDFVELNTRGGIVSSIGADFKLESFAIRLSEYTGSLDEIEGLLMLAVGKPSREWTDRLVDAGEIQLLSWAMEFRRLESLAEVRNLPVSRQAIGVVFGSKKTVTGTFDISEKDVVVAQVFANELLIKMATDNVKREVFLAAIAEAGAKIFESMRVEQETSSNE